MCATCTNFYQKISTNPAIWQLQIRERGEDPEKIGSEILKNFGGDLGWKWRFFLAPWKHSRVVALYDFHGEAVEELSFLESDVLVTINRDPSGWWRAVNKNKMCGWIPSNYIQEK
jgi:hypothetical protein